VKAYDASGNIGTASLGVTVDNTTAPPPVTSTCSGIAVSPGQLTQALVNNYPEGTTFCIKAGTHALATSILAKSYDTFIGESGTVLDFAQASLSAGSDGTKYCFLGYQSAQSFVTVKSLTITNCSYGARAAGLKLGWNWTIDKVEVKNAYDGVHVSNNAVVRNSYFHHNNQYGLAGGPTSNILIENSELAFNDLCHCHPGDDGASKIVGSTAGTVGVTWRGNWVHDNGGIGIWSDGNVRNVTIENNRIDNNSEAGIGHEISWDAIIRYNTLTNNGQYLIGKSCWNGGIIGINNSQNVQIYGNTIESAQGANGICTVDVDRSEGAPYYPTGTANVSVHDNILRISRASNVEYASQNGAVGRSINSVTFNNNTYYVKNTSDTYWAYLSYPLNWTTFRSNGQESTGTIQLW
jgi:hypothetical protein